MICSLARPDITVSERRAVLEVLKTPNLSLGPKLAEFEKRVSRYLKMKYAIAVSSGTSGLHLLIKSLGIGTGDEVITTPFSFIASANCILFEKAKPVFADINEKDLNINPENIKRAITKKTKAILVVDVFGHPADWDRISRIAKAHRLKVIEDSCEAFGSRYKSKKCGNFGDAAVFAFYPNKQITTGEGGMIVTNDKKIARLCRSMRNQGRGNDSKEWLVHEMLGYNYRLSDLNCALGIEQLKRIDDILVRRSNLAEMYSSKLSHVSEIELPYVSPHVKVSWFVYVIKLTTKFRRNQRDKILTILRAKGIECSNYFPPIHLQPFYRKMFGCKEGDFPIAESISKRTIALPFYNNLNSKQVGYIVKSLKEALIKTK